MAVKISPNMKVKTVSMRMTEALNHFLDTRVMELRKIAENKKNLDKTWLMLRLMELGQDWLASYHLGIPTDYEEWLLKEIIATERQLKKASKKPGHEPIVSNFEEVAELKGKLAGLKKAHELFDQYEELICAIGDDEENIVT